VVNDMTPSRDPFGEFWTPTELLGMAVILALLFLGVAGSLIDWKGWLEGLQR
jgi:hypothetical protein